MNRQQLAHLLRAACNVTGDEDVLVIGSQSILGTYDEDDLPSAATASIEADIAFLDDPDRAKADQVEAAIGEMSPFHSSNDVYAEGTHIETALLPHGWRDRLVAWGLVSSHPAKPRFLEPHDLAISKLAAARQKDTAFVDALIAHDLLDVPTLRERVALLPEGTDPRTTDYISVFLDHYDGRGQAKPDTRDSTPCRGGGTSGTQPRGRADSPP